MITDLESLRVPLGMSLQVSLKSQAGKKAAFQFHKFWTELNLVKLRVCSLKTDGQAWEVATQLNPPRKNGYLLQSQDTLGNMKLDLWMLKLDGVGNKNNANFKYKSWYLWLLSVHTSCAGVWSKFLFVFVSGFGCWLLLLVDSFDVQLCHVKEVELLAVKLTTPLHEKSKAIAEASSASATAHHSAHCLISHITQWRISPQPPVHT